MSQASDSADFRGRRSGKPPGESIPQLSCELCRKRKVKCDKLNPCSNCVKADVVCVPIHRKRLPRGRHTHPRSFPTCNTGDELMSRIRNLETLASNINDLKVSSPNPGPSTSTNSNVGVDAENNVGWKVWAQIVDEVEGLRNIVGDASDDEDSVRSIPNSTFGANLRAIGIGSSSYSSLPTTNDRLKDPIVTAQLCDIYLHQVDPIIKILHRPSLSKFMQHGQRYLGYDTNHLSTVCLKSAVCYSAAASMTEERCQQLFNIRKSTLIEECRAACEATLESSELLTTNDITVLQAFVLYLIARRTEDSSRAVWTMTALAVRIAKALSLHQVRGESFFNRQMRLRLWFTICLLDLQGSIDQATQPLIGVDEIPPDFPLNVNDSEFDIDTPGELQSRSGLTDITYALVTYYAQPSARLLNFHGKEADRLNWEERERHSFLVQQKIQSLLKFCDPESSPYAWFTFHGGQSLVACMRLAALRPLHRVNTNQPAPRGKLTEILNNSLVTLEKVHLIQTGPRGEGFRWYMTVHWHALASAIAECYVGSDISAIQNAWPIIEWAFEYHRQAIESCRRGMLKRPLERLMMQARKRISVLLGHPTSLQQSQQALFSPNQAGYSEYGLSNSTATNIDPNSAGFSLNQVDPQVTMGYDFSSGADMFPYFDNSTMANPSMLSWSAPHDPGAQVPGTLNVSEGDNGSFEDVSWKTWEEFVSELSFNDLN
ncbi:uncharacterized protein F4812DRAFT_455015 [Daldinia caldariorum]|uniref:uncharacterized protein n=1 Tax=Daldinia caldariorum TaxID=326644 RepID=UPI002007CA3B|nr:uncharacterized protein F4812DRAFT_455015 [Daldinia caldariorum]KAI1473201.1 hypothetical protein F4812DRAFT_455015 [Daldinia caldariorum]